MSPSKLLLECQLCPQTIRPPNRRSSSHICIGSGTGPGTEQVMPAGRESGSLVFFLYTSQGMMSCDSLWIDAGFIRWCVFSSNRR